MKVTRTTLAVIVGLVVLVGIVFGVRTCGGASGDGLSDLTSEAGAEALQQIYGHADVETAEDGSGQPSAVEVSSAEVIGGRVVLPNGEPAVGALVTAVNPVSGQLVESTADAGGSFQFAGLAPAMYVVEASDDGYGPAIIVGVNPGGSPLLLGLQSGRDVEGLVLHDGAPVPYAVVHVGGPGMFPQRSVIADSRGRFSVAGLRAGRYEMVVAGPGVGSGYGGTLSIDDPQEPGAIRLDIPVYRSAETTLRVLDRRTGEPVPFGVVTLTTGPMHVLSLSTALEFGETLVDYLPRGEYFLRVRAPGYLPYARRLFVGNTDESVDIRLSQGVTLAGHVLDEVGNPVAGARLAAVVETNEGGRWELRRSLFDDFHRLVRPDGTPFWLPGSIYSTDTEGAFELSGIPPGTAQLIAELDGYAPAVSARLIVSSDQRYDDITLRLDAARRIRGRVEDAGGGAIEGAVVSARSAALPSWASPDGFITGTNGVFDLAGVGADVVLRVEHPDFAPAEFNLEVPQEGLDDFIVQLSGEQLPSISGRLFTSRGAPAVGGRVWLMAGGSEVPVCRATVGNDAWFRATHCSATPGRIIASAAGHAPLMVEIGEAGEARDWELPIGGELALVSQRNPVFVSVEPRAVLPRSHWPRPAMGLDRWSRNVVEHVPAGLYDVTCQTEGFEDMTVEVRVAEGRRAEAACPAPIRLVSFPLFVIDGQGAPVSDALVLVDGVDPPLRAFTDGRGRVDVEARPGRWLVAEAVHEEWGRGVLPLQSPDEPPNDAFRVRLDQSIAGEDSEAFVTELQSWGVDVAVDGRSVVVDTVRAGTAAAGSGVRRFDKLLWARPVSDYRFSIGVRRQGELVTYEIVGEPDTSSESGSQ